ncbi:hypothetical protein N7539_009510 [Penicillium diatomitis]|uniref:Uncharacterized protein n=1 Tax=Penicillium diatomitis TaxID=2819901 RepID=A0A9X0BIZ8_9EURO|nr:uncharacterized protein N7539_009510 [Penicillium diatomitis]KAJ5466554.1 hypothetical protein N7539_009510 [Penicillium diatomitis]
MSLYRPIYSPESIRTHKLDLKSLVNPPEASSSIDSPAYEVRLACRQNTINNTAGLATGHLQANLLVRSARYAGDFYDLCLRNPVSCPLLAMSAKPGDCHDVRPAGCIQTPDFDLRTDFPQYRVYQDGRLVDSTRDLVALWTPATSPADQESRANVPLEYLPTSRGLFQRRPLYCIDETLPTGSDRPCQRHHKNISVPVAWGWEGAKSLGIFDIRKPDFGEVPDFDPDEVPIFWVRSLLESSRQFESVPLVLISDASFDWKEQACGVTPRIAVEAAGDRIDGLVFAHEPGNILVTDWTVADLHNLQPRMVWS